MPAELIRDPLGTVVSLPGHEPFSLDLSDLPNLLLAADLVEGLAGSVHPNGPLTKPSSVRSFESSLRRMVRDFTKDGFTGSAADLTRAALISYWLRSHYLVEYRTRQMLRALETGRPVLTEPVRQMVFGVNFTRPAPHRPLAAYQPAEWQRLVAACRDDIRLHWGRHQEMTALAEAGRDPAHAGWSDQNGAWLMARLGPASAEAVASHVGLTRSAFEKRYGGIRHLRSALFPSNLQAAPYLLLMGAWTGIVPDGLAGIGLGDIQWSGRQAMLLNYTKGRTAEESLVLSPRASALLHQWLQHSALLRRHAPSELRDRVWIATNSQVRICPTYAGDWVLRRWVANHGLSGENGEPLSIDRRRLRTTFIAQRGQRQWSLRATIDPNHSPQVEGDHYLEPATPAQRAVVEEIISDAQADLLRRATAPAVVDEATTAAALPDEVQRLGLGGEALAELMSGQRDVFTAACSDLLAGLHGPKGKPCPARPWVCLLCPLAVFAPRHLPNLLRLKGYFARQFRAMPREQFAVVFAPYAHRLSSQILPRFPEPAVTAAQGEVRDRDDELPLRAEELTQGGAGR
ncbi:hypothetical protein [Kitasatospora purpeofusca]|uniref:hypothetical protein n=1 Tax=Kitasatospora purpeofusca TaxID=67352 RepID=UPI0036D425F3